MGGFGGGDIDYSYHIMSNNVRIDSHKDHAIFFRPEINSTAERNTQATSSSLVDPDHAGFPVRSEHSVIIMISSEIPRLQDEKPMNYIVFHTHTLLPLLGTMVFRVLKSTTVLKY